MPLIFSFILGLSITSVVIRAQFSETSTNNTSSTEFPTKQMSTINITSTTNISTISSTTDNLNTFSTTITVNDNSYQDAQSTETGISPYRSTTPAPASSTTNPIIQTSLSANPTTKKDGNNNKDKTGSYKGDSIGIIVLIVIIVAGLLFVVACFFARKRGQRYSVDLNSRPDEANIPLSTVEPEMPVEAASEKGLKTFEVTETAPAEAEEPEDKPEAQTGEADKAAVDPSPETAAPAPDKVEDEVGPVEQSPAEAAEPSVDEKTDDEGLVSNKTSVESLKETNENNSNNADFGQKRDMQPCNMLWEVCIDSPV